MGVTEFFYLFAALLAGIIATAGYGVLTLSPTAFRFARACCWGTALLVASIGIVWGITTSESMWVRMPVIALAGMISAVGLSESLRWVHKREAAVAVTDDRTLADSRHVEMPAGAIVLHAQCNSLGLLDDVQKNVALTYTLAISLVESGQPLYGLTHLTPPLPTISLGPSKFPQLVYKCEVTNYGSIPVLNVRMFLNIDFQKPVERPGGGGFQGAGPLSRIEWPIDIAKIDPGQSNPFVFYFYNVSPYFAMVKIGDSVSFQRVDEGDRRITKIVQPQYSPDFPILLLPFQKTDPTPNKKG